MRTRGTIFALCLAGLVMSFFPMPHYGRAAETEAEKAAALIEGAKKEGKVVWYTVLNVIESDRILKRFKEKYPFIAVDLYRAGNDKLFIKIMGEFEAKKHYSDVISINLAESQLMLRKGIFAKYPSPQRKYYPETFKDAEGYWTAMYMNLTVLGYNTKLVSLREAPKTHEDLLLPRWKGKMGMDTKAYGWFAGALKYMGEKKGLEYMKKLGEQGIQFRTGHTLNAQMVAAGEVNLSITCYNQRMEEMKAKGASVDWVALEPLAPEVYPLAVSAQAPHPHAARLLADFILSREGQELIAGFYRIPARADVEPIVPTMRRGLKIMEPNYELADNYERISKLYRELLLRR